MSKETLNHVVAGALISFLAWASTREKQLILSLHGDASHMAEAYRDFMRDTRIAQCEPDLGWADRCERLKDSTILPDGSAYFTASFPLPPDHWLYKPREYAPGAEDPTDLPNPIFTHHMAEHVVNAARYAIRAATMNGREKDFDPDALVQNMVYALCGPYGGPKNCVELNTGDLVKDILAGD